MRKQLEFYLSWSSFSNEMILSPYISNPIISSQDYLPESLIGYYRQKNDLAFDNFQKSMIDLTSSYLSSIDTLEVIPPSFDWFHFALLSLNDGLKEQYMPPDGEGLQKRP
ncbi:101_t:CDS:2 [Diversispora eburnea]|uniref:101_t:CDS:1 n=1 Tax=Diversispora eburnea TaxID=1213867 RepID=A0A9N8VJ84_9GLOM|nr:101_t:CDS:2 [Diversispora eburnea]